ncbi:PIN domain-containing protein [Epidermidibacterium keratini]|uniref:Ribonuclease VapC n=1 Tax=Epidermidibacterium keratini TaxID=1891644 RepID=A0A7L4YS66_9ACTN|nr:PIN domain nuclease [Epidermidibacterium keratini]QHC01898.1 PIN domain-containing protein [Epidermidibacterium keratini]
MSALVDTSVWVEFLRGTQSAAADYVRHEVGRNLATCEPVMMELLAGLSAGDRTARVERMLLSQTWLRIDPHLDYRGAVDVFHATRATGHAPRGLADCLIAAIALRAGVEVAHRDTDYEYIAAATGLATIDLRERTAAG